MNLPESLCKEMGVVSAALYSFLKENTDKSGRVLLSEGQIKEHIGLSIKHQRTIKERFPNLFVQRRAGLFIESRESGFFDDDISVEDSLSQILGCFLTPQKIYDAWNLLAKETGVCQCSFMANTLRSKVKKNLKTFSSEQWKTTFFNILKNDWLHNKKWLTLSWLMNQENFTKILDDAYKQEDTRGVGTKSSVNKMFKDWQTKQRRK